MIDYEGGIFLNGMGVGAILSACLVSLLFVMIG
jgi:hypothetical protein